MATPLGRVLELDAPTAGPCGQLTVDVLDAWLAPGTVLDVVVPVRLACGRCEGGGCDACGKSGAIRLSGDEQRRSLRITLSASARVVRLVRPLGEDAGLDLLVIELRPAAVPSHFCRRAQREGGKSALIPLLVVVLVAALIAALVLHR